MKARRRHRESIYTFDASNCARSFFDASHVDWPLNEHPRSSLVSLAIPASGSYCSLTPEWGAEKTILWIPYFQRLAFFPRIDDVADDLVSGHYAKLGERIERCFDNTKTDQIDNRDPLI